MVLAGGLLDVGSLRIGGDVSQIRPGALLKASEERVQKFVLKCVPDVAKATFCLATGKRDGPLFPKNKLDALREDWFRMLPDPERAQEVTPGQPFFLRAMAQTLEILKDPDFGIVEQGKYCFCNGVEVGHLRPLSPVPQVYRLRRKDQKYDDSSWEPEMRNYGEGPGVERALQEAFEKEEREGRMFPLSLGEAKKRYPGNQLRIAAQAVIQTTIFGWSMTPPTASRHPRRPGEQRDCHEGQP